MNVCRACRGPLHVPGGWYCCVFCVGQANRNVPPVPDTPVNRALGKILCCSFCGKSQKEVAKLIAGPSVYICNECVDMCNEVIKEAGAAKKKGDK